MSVLSKEKWVWVKYKGVEYKNLYMVSNLGRAVKIQNGKIRFVSSNTQQRRNISLSKDGESIVIPLARAVYYSFHPENNNKKLVVDHINNTPFDDRLCNLQLITNSENIIKDHFGTKKKKIPCSNKRYLGVTKSISGNKLYSHKQINLGYYPTIKMADDIKKIVENVIKKYKTLNNDKILMACMGEIYKFRKANGLKPIRRHSVKSSKIIIGKYSYGMNFNDTIIYDPEMHSLDSHIKGGEVKVGPEKTGTDETQI